MAESDPTRARPRLLRSDYAPPGAERARRLPLHPRHLPPSRSPGSWASTPGSARPRESNQRFRRLLDAGQTGFSVALDLPTQMGLDSDDPRAAGEVGRVGVAIDSSPTSRS